MAITADDWFDLTLYDDLASSSGKLSWAVSASVLGHAAIFLGLLTVTFLPSEPEQISADQSSSIAITLVKISPASSDSQPLQDVDTLTALQSVDNQAALRPMLVDIPALRISEATEPDSAVEPMPETDTSDDQPLVTDRVSALAFANSAITGYREVLQTDLHREFVDGCTRYRNRYGPTQDCPDSFDNDYRGHQEERAVVDDLFANVTRDADDARMSRKLEADNEFLEDVMDAGGLAGEQAEIRWRLNRQYHAYLNGNIVPELAYRAETAFVNDFNRTITPAPFQFRCKQWPCVYKFTGFSVKRPQTYEEEDPGFVVRPPLFKPSQD